MGNRYFRQMFSQRSNILIRSFTGTAMGVWVSGGISGGHINPAVTLALAVWRGFPWRKVPGYILAQTLGGLVGAALVYANYYHAISIFEGGATIRTQATASLFTTYALDYMTMVSCFWSEFLGTVVLMLVVLAMTDKRNLPPPNGLTPLVLFILILGIGASWGMETAYAINPARDLGPRLFLSMVGYGKQVYTYRNHYWIWCPILAPIIGAQVATCLYDAFLFMGEEGRFNQPSKAARLAHAHAHPDQRGPVPAGPNEGEISHYDIHAEKNV
jgi:aquaglyceroporin related protein